MNASILFTPEDWWWTKVDNGTEILYSSKLQSIYRLEDALKTKDFQKFRARGGTPTVWPKDKDGLQTQEELESMLSKLYGIKMWPESLDEIKEAEIKKIKAQTAASIVEGFDYQVGGELYHFSYDENDQLNMLMSMTEARNHLNSVNNEDTDEIKYKNRGYPVRNGEKQKEAVELEFSAVDFIHFVTFADDMKNKKLQKGWDLQRRVKEAKTEKEVVQVVKDGQDS